MTKQLNIFGEEETITSKKETSLILPSFKLKTGNTNSTIDTIEINKEDNSVKESKNKKKEKEVNEIINIPSGAILRIDGKEYQNKLVIIPGETYTLNQIKDQIVNPKGNINKFELKSAELKYDAKFNVFYPIKESPKKG
ncbi:hypothetical protein [Spiroplasma sp. DGKH1]|uniref:hypothetical protein n=1 Tax=Spiroplasma sp. DGKH1 TaxID=3050074 RepID=UPI0034C68575